eukprot:363330-Chlamydomonas_euryale.AAC.12
MPVLGTGKQWDSMPVLRITLRWWLTLPFLAPNAQYFRVYSPVAFGKKYDPEGKYIRKFLPVLKDMPSKFIYEPWLAPRDVQERAKCIIGRYALCVSMLPLGTQCSVVCCCLGQSSGNDGSRGVCVAFRKASMHYPPLLLFLHLGTPSRSHPSLIPSSCFRRVFQAEAANFKQFFKSSASCVCLPSCPHSGARSHTRSGGGGSWFLSVPYNLLLVPCIHVRDHACSDYPRPIVDHGNASKACISRIAAAYRAGKDAAGDDGDAGGSGAKTPATKPRSSGKAKAEPAQGKGSGRASKGKPVAGAEGTGGTRKRQKTMLESGITVEKKEP